MPVLFSFQQVREDLSRHVEELSFEQVWRKTPGGTVGFQLKHLAGSIDRISTYLIGKSLSPEQFETLAGEADPGDGVRELLRHVFESLRVAEERACAVDPATLYDFRGVGRESLPSTVIGLLVHLAEHTQRHLGQAITLAKIVRSSETQPQKS